MAVSVASDTGAHLELAYLQIADVRDSVRAGRPERASISGWLAYVDLRFPQSPTVRAQRRRLVEAGLENLEARRGASSQRVLGAGTRGSGT